MAYCYLTCYGALRVSAVWKASLSLNGAIEAHCTRARDDEEMGTNRGSSEQNGIQIHGRCFDLPREWTRWLRMR